MGRVTEWQARTLEPIYPVVYLNCIVVKIRENQQVAKNPLYLALGVDLNGHKDLPVSGSQKTKALSSGSACSLTVSGKLRASS